MQTNTPFYQWNELFVDLQHAGIFTDSKKIADGVADRPLEELNQLYVEQKNEDGFSLEKFVNQHFTFFEATNEAVVERPIREHLEHLWEVLLRPSDAEEESSKIPLPYSYIVPGGRFNEIYYWDSYFTMQGLLVSGRLDIIESMVYNFTWMIENLGFIPNGNRSYFLSRSQPPFYALMVELLVSNSDKKMGDYIHSIEREYEYWMDESEISTSYTASVNNYKLNRYFDRWHEPRDESYKEDVELAEENPEEAEELFLHIRSACESGWDFSSRWFSIEKELGSIKCADIAPIDLNCLLASYERILAEYYKDEEKGKRYESYYQARKRAIQILFFDEADAFFYDVNISNGKCIKKRKTLAAMFPLFLHLATQEQADACAKVIKEEFLRDGGVVTTLIHSGQQWDAPNGWAPLQWVTVKGLMNYGHNDLAKEIAKRWLTLNKGVFKRTGKMMEKYNVEDITLLAGGGEYEGQSGFGWTNGVYLGLADMFNE